MVIAEKAAIRSLANVQCRRSALLLLGLPLSLPPGLPLSLPLDYRQLQVHRPLELFQPMLVVAMPTAPLLGA